MNHDRFYSFAFRGLLTQEALEKDGHSQKANYKDEWEAETSKRLGLPSLDEELVAKARKMSLVYTAICAFENSVREFVAKKLLEEKR